MTTQALSTNIPETLSFRFHNWTANHPKFTLITAIACSILGIACAAGSAAVLIPFTQMTLMFTATAAVLLSIGLFVSYVNNSSADREKNAHYLTQVMQQTLQDLKNGYYRAPNGSTYSLSMQNAIAGTAFFPSAGPTGVRAGTRSTTFQVLNQDCLDVARELQAQGLNPLLLDLANADDVGGGYLRGAKAQEEDICRRSGLSVAIDTRHGMQTQQYYPLNQLHPYAGLYVPHVPVFRDGLYRYLDQPFTVAIGAVAAVCRPVLQTVSGRLRLNPQDAQITRERIRTILEMAYRNGHRSLVLGALGCGAFHNPPEHIAEIMREVILSEYPHCFDQIVFAIYDDHNARKRHNPQGNWNPFAHVFNSIV